MKLIEKDTKPSTRLQGEVLHKQVVRDKFLYPLAKQCEKARQALEDAKKYAEEHRNG